MEGQGDHHRANPSLSDRNHHKTPSHFVQINQHHELMQFQPSNMLVWLFVCLFVSSRQVFAGRGFCNPNSSTASTRRWAEPCSRLEVASSSSKWETEGNTDAGDAAPCSRDSCPTSNLASRHRPTTAALRVQWEEEEDSDQEGKGNREAVRKLPESLLFLLRKKKLK